MTSSSARRAVVIGAGVIGLTTAVLLAEAEWRVTVLSADDVLGTTSSVAGALVGLTLESGNRLSRWTAETAKVMTALSAERATGIHMTRGLIAERRPIGVPRVVESMPGFAVANPSELPHEFVQGCWLTLPLVDMHRYLIYLTDRLRSAGGEIVRRRITRIDELDGAADAVANCSGLGARTLVGDVAVVPTFGQHLVVTNPGISHFFIDGLVSESEWIAWYPYPTHVIIGGVAREGRWETTPDLELARRFHTRAARVLPAFCKAEVLGHRAGLRPHRPTVRVELEMVRSLPVVHNYGHGRIGVSLSWSCAREAATMLAAAAEFRG